MHRVYYWCWHAIILLCSCRVGYTKVTCSPNSSFVLSDVNKMTYLEIPSSVNFSCHQMTLRLGWRGNGVLMTIASNKQTRHSVVVSLLLLSERGHACLPRKDLRPEDNAINNVCSILWNCCFYRKLLHSIGQVLQLSLFVMLWNPDGVAVFGELVSITAHILESFQNQCC